MTARPIEIPAAGARIGRICGPGEHPRDAAGVVLCQLTNRWGVHALVLMDDGTTTACHGMTAGPGIGWHYL